MAAISECQLGLVLACQASRSMPKDMPLPEIKPVGNAVEFFCVPWRQPWPWFGAAGAAVVGKQKPQSNPAPLAIQEHSLVNPRPAPQTQTTKYWIMASGNSALPSESQGGDWAKNLKAPRGACGGLQDPGFVV